MRQAWDNHIRFGLANPTLFTYLADPQRAAHSPAAAAGQAVLRTRVKRVAAAGRLRVPEQRAVELIHAAGTGAVLTLLSVPAEDRVPSIADDLRDAVLRAVLTEPHPPAGSNPTAIAAITLASNADELTALTSGERALLREWLNRVATPAPGDVPWATAWSR